MGSFYWYGSGTLVTAAIAEAPDCSHIAPYCFSDWTVTGNYGPLLGTEESGKYTGGVSLRKALNTNLAHCDGHVKFMPAGQAAIGTDWVKGKSAGTINIKTPTLYKWEAAP